MSHIDRMKQEARELSDKIDALDSFIKTNKIFKSLPEEEVLDLFKQKLFMDSYLETLSRRISRA